MPFNGLIEINDLTLTSVSFQLTCNMRVISLNGSQSIACALLRSFLNSVLFVKTARSVTTSANASISMRFMYRFAYKSLGRHDFACISMNYNRS